jgi:competence protein ComEA
MNSVKSLLSMLCLVPVVALAGPVDINSADARTLSKELKGIGPARAEAIIRYRTQNGPFKSADELAMVKNIPQKVIDANRPDIRVEKSAATPDKGHAATVHPATASKFGPAPHR